MDRSETGKPRGQKSIARILAPQEHIVKRGPVHRPSQHSILPRINSQWFIELVERLGRQVWMGDAARIPGQVRAAAED
jgi:hypothetical protein